MRRAVMPVLALTLATLPSAAAATRNGSPSTELADLIPAGGFSLTESEGHRDVAGPGIRPDELTDLVDTRDPRTYPDAARAVIEARMGIALPDLRPAHSSRGEGIPYLQATPPEAGLDQPPEPEPEPEPTGTFAYPSPAGDLTGDGLADVLVWEMTLPRERIVIRALRGRDGTELWSVRLDAADAFAYPVGDLTGDGIDDLVEEGFEITDEESTESCTSGDCRYEYEATYEWLIQLRSGADGGGVWSKRYAGSSSYRQRYRSQGNVVISSSSVEETVEAPNWVVLSLPSGDHDGDRRNDVLVDSLDLDFHGSTEFTRTAVITEWRGEERLRTATRVQVVGGGDGGVLVDLESEKAPEIGLPWPVGNLVGDEAPDLLWDSVVIPDYEYSCRTAVVVSDCPHPPALAFKVAVLDGQDLKQAWGLLLDDVDDVFADSLGADVSGDGHEDVWLSTVTFEEDGIDFELRILSGTDGQGIWERKGGDWEVPLVAANIGGGPGTDLLLGAFVIEETADPSIKFIRVEGSSGAVLFQTTRRLRTVSQSHDLVGTYTYIGWMGDAEGDATADVYAGALGQGIDEDPLTGEWTVSEQGSSTLAESTLTGDLLHEEQGPTLFGIVPMPDLDGDGRSDAYTWRSPAEEGRQYEVAVHQLGPTRPLWSRWFTREELDATSLWPAGNQDGRPGDEILYGANLEEEFHWRSVIASLAGATGHERWRVER